MTRKRFVKLLMADGYSRNEANKLATDVQYCGLSYSTAYRTESDMRGAIIKFKNIGFTAGRDAFRNIAEAAVKVVSAIAKAANAFAETYTAEMEALNHE